MFQEQMQVCSSKLRSEFPSEPHASISLDVQYEICSKFMKRASEQIYQRQLQIIHSTSKFLQKYQDLVGQKDISSTQQSRTIQNFFDEDDSFSQPSRSRLLLRKSKSNTSLRRTQNGLNEALREIQQNCSERTSSMLSNMAAQYRRVKQKLATTEKFEKELKRLEARYQSTEEELFVNRKRVSDLESESKIHGEEMQGLKKRLKQATEHSKQNSLSLSKSSDNLKSLSHNSPPDKMRKYLQQKQLRIFKKQRQIRSIQDKIQQTLDSILPDESCSKCCTMMKRVKQGIMKYRAFLEEEANVAQEWYNGIKKHFS